MARIARLEQVQVLPRRRDEVFPFFEDAANLERLTPPNLAFAILTPAPIAMAEGTVIDYRIRLSGVPLRWRTRIDVYEPPARFVDRQVTGPYRLWRHEHVFLETAAGHTVMIDRVDYQVPLPIAGRLARAVYVDRQLARIFAHRRRVVAEIFGGEPPPS